MDDTMVDGTFVQKPLHKISATIPQLLSAPGRVRGTHGPICTHARNGDPKGRTKIAVFYGIEGEMGDIATGNSRGDTRAAVLAAGSPVVFGENSHGIR